MYQCCACCRCVCHNQLYNSQNSNFIHKLTHSRQQHNRSEVKMKILEKIKQMKCSKDIKNKLKKSKRKLGLQNKVYNEVIKNDSIQKVEHISQLTLEQQPVLFEVEDKPLTRRKIVIKREKPPISQPTIRVYLSQLSLTLQTLQSYLRKPDYSIPNQPIHNLQKQGQFIKKQQLAYLFVNYGYNYKLLKEYPIKEIQNLRRNQYGNFNIQMVRITLREVEMKLITNCQIDIKKTTFKEFNLLRMKLLKARQFFNSNMLAIYFRIIRFLFLLQNQQSLNQRLTQHELIGLYKYFITTIRTQLIEKLKDFEQKQKIDQYQSQQQISEYNFDNLQQKVQVDKKTSKMLKKKQKAQKKLYYQSQSQHINKKY